METLEIIAFIVLFVGIVIIGNEVSGARKDMASKLEDLQNDVQDMKDEWDDKFGDTDSNVDNI